MMKHKNGQVIKKHGPKDPIPQEVTNKRGQVLGLIRAESIGGGWFFAHYNRK